MKYHPCLVNHGGGQVKTGGGLVNHPPEIPEPWFGLLNNPLELLNHRGDLIIPGLKVFH